MNVHFSSCISEIRALSSPEVHTDELSLGIYATDASLYQLQPLAVVVPKSEQDVIDVVAIAQRYKFPILPRGSATSLAGQTTNGAIILDFTKYINQIKKINPDQKWAVVQPGVVRDELNAAVKKYNLHFAPDPATTSRATLGGIIANNSSGTKSIKYGKTIDHIIALKVLLMNGTLLEVSLLDAESWDTKCQIDSYEGQIYRKLRALIFEHAEEIKKVYPKVLRSVQGYPLDYFVNHADWNLSWIFAGSEGSLGIILEATVNLEPIPQYKTAIALHYHDRIESIEEVRFIVDFKPAAIEMLDYHVFEKSKIHPLTKSIHRRIIQDEPKSIMTVEFFSNDEKELNQQVLGFLEWVKKESKAYAYPVFRTEDELEQVWSLRKNGLGLIMGDPDGRKPIPFIEDMAIPLEHLAHYIKDILHICQLYEVETILYAHASVGVLHVRPSLDMTKAADIVTMKKISDEVFTLVKRYGGAWSGEHGDGRNRGHRLLDFFGPEVYKCLREVKSIFDPENLLNPGIIIDVPPMDEHLRYGADYKDEKNEFLFSYKKDHSFEAIIHNCSGVGACRNKSGGTMCPSFRATFDEKDSTRGRANALRLAMSGQLGFRSVTDKKVLDALDLCLSCKACKSECPSNVDMAKLKSEVLQKKYDEQGIGFREKLILNQTKIARTLSGRIAPMVNGIQKLYLFRVMVEKISGLHRKRVLPPYATQKLDQWYSKRQPGFTSNRKVALFSDCYINYHETNVGKAAIRLLEECGYEVDLVQAGCCGRPKISNGFLREAKEDGNLLVEQLLPYLVNGIPVLTCEPSCSSALLDDLPDLIEDQGKAEKMQTGIFQIDVFLAREWTEGRLKGKWKMDDKNVMIHGHCHQKASVGTASMHTIFKEIQGLNFSEPDTGCCGMAGSFGYEKEHYEISKKIAHQVLIPAIKNLEKESLVIANGFSCRHQISDFSDIKAKHWVECIHFAKE